MINFYLRLTTATVPLQLPMIFLHAHQALYDRFPMKRQLQFFDFFRLCWCSSPTILLEGWSLAVCEEHKQRRLKFQFKIFILLY